MLGAQPGIPACVSPPKLIRACADVPALNPSTSVDDGLLVSNDSLTTVFEFLPEAFSRNVSVFELNLQ